MTTEERDKHAYNILVGLLHKPDKIVSIDGCGIHYEHYYNIAFTTLNTKNEQRTIQSLKPYNCSKSDYSYYDKLIKINPEDTILNFKVTTPYNEYFISNLDFVKYSEILDLIRKAETSFEERTIKDELNFISYNTDIDE